MSDPARNGIISAADAAALSPSALLPFAAGYAVAPISNFHVGAVAVGASGAFYYGANLEVAGAALAFTLHAEQAAIANAWMHGETGVRAIAISAAPCGYCRQFLYELSGAARLMIALPGAEPAPLTAFLPSAFGPADLGQAGGLMDPADHGLTLATKPDALTAAALAAANHAYSPYTSTFSGVALQAASGRIVSGAYAENAAFNPSLSPLAIALSLLVLHGEPLNNITAACIVENADAPASQIGAARVVLDALTATPLSVVTV